MVDGMKIGIFFHKHQVDDSYANILLSALRSGGAEAETVDGEDAIKGFDRLIVLGGDGTVLKAARLAAEAGIPLFGINFGRIGFLTEFERDDLEEAVSLALSEDCDLLDRTMLEVDLGGKRAFCLNECSLLRSVTPQDENKVVRVGVRLDGSDAEEIAADGIIVATPTGSTAYSLSAGGSIMTPECETFMLTPVCAFSMKSRPIVYAASAVLSFTVSEGDLLLYCDGGFFGELRAGSTVVVKRADRVATFLTRNKHGYFMKITEKIK